MLLLAWLIECCYGTAARVADSMCGDMRICEQLCNCMHGDADVWLMLRHVACAFTILVSTGLTDYVVIEELDEAFCILEQLLD
jgi:hypothetical protein